MSSDANDLLDRNLTALPPAVRRALDTERDDHDAPRVDRAGVVSTPDGRSVRLHSARSPVEEAAALLEPVLRTHPPLLVVLGLGFGHLLDALEQAAPTTKIAAIEPVPELTRAMLATRDCREWLNSGRLTMIVGPDYSGASEAWKTLDAGATAPPVVVMPTVERIWPNEVTRARTIANGIIAGAAANEEARRRFAGRYLLNTLTNLRTIGSEACVTSLFDAFTNVPAVIVAAGPSLDRVLEQVRALANRALIVAVDTAVRPLLAAGIRPHVAVAVDPSEANARHLVELPDARDIWFVAEGSIDAAVFPQFSGRTFTFKVSTHEPWPWLSANGIERGSLRAWGSVLTTAFDLAIRAGCNPIVFAGADLAYSRGLQYCRNTVYEPEWSHWKTDEERAAALIPWLAERQTLTQPDVNGEPVLTTPAFIQFRDWLVARAAEAGRVTLNATGGGILYGPSLKMLDLAKWVELPDDARVDARTRLAAAWRAGAAERVPALRKLHAAAAQPDAALPIAAWLDFARHTITADDIRGRLAHLET